MQTHRKDGTLFFNQEVNEEVVAYFRQDQIVGTGTRMGDRVFITKIPYLAKELIHEKDIKKRTLLLAQPMDSQSPMRGGSTIDPVFYVYSNGYLKNFWVAILNQPVRVRVLQSFINGDEVCEFAAHLPPEFIKNINTAPQK